MQPTFDSTQSSRFGPCFEARPAALLYEDDWLMAFDKPAGLLVHPTFPDGRPTLIDQARLVCSDATLMHRLDRETSGVVLVAKSPKATRWLAKAFQKRTIQKNYLAVVHGVPPEPTGTIDAPLGQAEGSEVRIRRAVVRTGGERAVTGFRVLQSFGGFSLLAVKPYTGRLHQIRVHLSFLGTPVVGDKIYGSDEREFIRFIETGMTPEMEARLLLARHALHAARVEFLHHNLRRDVEIAAPLPEDMREFVRCRGGNPEAAGSMEG
ncbi:MAG: hypothetical protein A2V83_08625 [Nitrospirae bacterium RBG_16_64_22]|nr:MAG: hypothetical protein A2V83_08625 [Nitrospirae bacterium RBG_16_64_22]